MYLLNVMQIIKEVDEQQNFPRFKFTFLLQSERSVKTKISIHKSITCSLQLFIK